MRHTYTAKYEGMVFTRTTSRIYTHVVVRSRNGSAWDAIAWAGRAELAARQAQAWRSKFPGDEVRVIGAGEPVEVRESVRSRYVVRIYGEDAVGLPDEARVKEYVTAHGGFIMRNYGYGGTLTRTIRNDGLALIVSLAGNLPLSGREPIGEITLAD